MIFEFFGPVRAHAGVKSLSIKINEPLSLVDALRLLPGQVRDLIIDEDGRIRAGILILVNDVDARSVYGYNLLIRNDDRVTIIPLIHGGAEHC